MSPRRTAAPSLLSALCLVAAAAKAEAPAFPVETIPRADLPYLVAALAIATPAPHPLQGLAAAWLAAPESFPDGPVAALRREGGRVSATSTQGGILLVVEGPAASEALVFGALRALVDDTPSLAGLPPARATALRVHDEALDHGPGATGEARTDVAAPLVTEAQLARCSEDELRFALAFTRAAATDARLFLEGATARPAEVAAVSSSWATRGLGRPWPRPALDVEEAPAFRQPVPTRLFDEVLAAAYVEVITAALPPSTPVRVRLDLAPGTSALVFEPVAPSLSLSLPELRAALLALREAPPAAEVLTAVLRRAALQAAVEAAPFGGQAIRRARAALLGLAPAVPAEGASALRRLLQLTLLPEVLHPAPPARGLPAATAPSAPSRSGPG